MFVYLVCKQVALVPIEGRVMKDFLVPLLGLEMSAKKTAMLFLYQQPVFHILINVMIDNNLNWASDLGPTQKNLQTKITGFYLKNIISPPGAIFQFFVLYTGAGRSRRAKNRPTNMTKIQEVEGVKHNYWHQCRWL